MTNEQRKVLELVEEMRTEEKKTQYVPHYYKRNGKMLRRHYDDEIETERYKELFYSEHGGIRGVKVFKCSKCGELVDFFNLETWLCDFNDEDGCICSDCYEEEMGDDL